MNSIRNETFFRPVLEEEKRKLKIKSPAGIDKLFIFNLNTQGIIEIDIIPETVSATYVANITKAQPLGTLHPINYYTGGSAKEISFKFDMHEDYLPNKNLYEFTDSIKEFSEPKVIKGLLKEPLVYLQLGTQFAGKGHIQTTISYNLPYRNGRYISASIDVHFVYHETFDVSELGITENIISQYVYQVGYNPLNLFGDNYESFLKEDVGIDYLIKNSFGDKRLQEIIGEQILSRTGSYDYRDYESLISALFADDTYTLLKFYEENKDKALEWGGPAGYHVGITDMKTDYYMPLDAYGDIVVFPIAAQDWYNALPFFYIEMVAIISSPIYNVSKINNLRQLKNKVSNIEEFYSLYVFEANRNTGMKYDLKRFEDNTYQYYKMLIKTIDEQIDNFVRLRRAIG